MKRALNLAISLAVTGLCSWYVFRDTDWSAQWANLRNANFWWLLPYLGVLLLIHLLRTLRWGALLSGLERVPFRRLNEASAIGFMMLIVLPFRLGEFARPFLIANRSGIRRSPAMTTVVLERIVDGILVAVLLRGLLFFVPEGSREYAVVSVAGNAMFVVFTGGLAFLLFAYWQHARAVRLIRAVAGRVSPRVAEEIARIVDGFVGALRQLPPRRELLKFLAYTVGYWGLNAFGMMVASQAFAGAGFELTLFQAYVVMCTLVVGVMIPSAPGMVGTFQLGITVGLSLFLPAAVVKSQGIAFANVLWLMQTGQQIGLGLITMSMAHLSFREIAGNLARGGAAQPPTDAGVAPIASPDQPVPSADLVARSR